MVGFLMVVAPRDGEIALDALDSILRYYVGSKVWIRYDGPVDSTFERLSVLSSARPDCIDLVRNPEPLGFYGVAVSVFRSFQRIYESEEDVEMIISLDPDVLLLGAGIDEFARIRFAREGFGIIGSYSLSPENTRRKHGAWAKRILLDFFPIGIDLKDNRIRLGFPFYAKYTWPALRNGYKFGHHVLGAFYIMHGETFRMLGNIGFWGSMPDAGSREVKLDDPLVSIGPYVVGHKLIELHDETRSKFWIQWRTPLLIAPVEIVRDGYLAVHPVKNDEAGSSLRQIVHEVRLQSLTPVPAIKWGSE